MRADSPCSCSEACAADPATDARDAGPAAVDCFRSSYRIPGMDCAAEEQLIRLSLRALPTRRLVFDLAARTLVVDHAGAVERVTACLTPLGFGAELQHSHPLRDTDAAPVGAADAERRQSRVLWLLLAINALMFGIELGAGWLSRSAGLIADATDMFADAAVYAVALYAVGRGTRQQLWAARGSGVLQLLLALGALAETARHAIAGSAPQAEGMIGIAALALAANVGCLLLLARQREGGVHMRASYIFSANDVLANAGVIVAGVLVAWTGSALPDWIVGFAVGLLVLIGGIRILRLR